MGNSLLEAIEDPEGDARHEADCREEGMEPGTAELLVYYGGPFGPIVVDITRAHPEIWEYVQELLAEQGPQDYITRRGTATGSSP